MVGGLVQIPVEAVASVDVGGVAAGFVDGDVKGVGIDEAFVGTVVGDDGVENGGFGESSDGGAAEGAEVVEHAVAAGQVGVERDGVGSIDGEVEGAVGNAVCGSVGVALAVDAGGGVFNAAPSASGATFFGHLRDGVDNDAEVECADSVAGVGGVGSGVGVGARGGVGAVVPSVVTAVFNVFMEVQSADDAEVEAVNVGAVVNEGSVVVDAGGGVGDTVPSVAAASIDIVIVNLDIRDGDVGNIHAVAEAGAGGGENGVAISSVSGISLTAPSSGATVAGNSFGGDKGDVDGQIEHIRGIGIICVEHNGVG